MKSYDAVIIGAGPNALVNAAYLTKAGWSVVVLEKHNRPGGGLRTEALTLPGFVHDVYAGFLILFAASQAAADFGGDLAARGLEMLHSTKPAGVSMPGGRASLLTTSMEENMAEAERLAPGDGGAWLDMLSTMGPLAPQIFGLLAMDLSSPAAQGMIKGLMLTEDGSGPSAFAHTFLTSARTFLESQFKSEVFRGLLAPWVFHTGHGPEEANSGFWDQVFAMGCQQAGQFVAKGGAENMAKALVRLVEDQGGEIVTNAAVTRVDVENGKAVGVTTTDGTQYRANRAVITSTNPDQLYLKLLGDDAVSPSIKKQAGQYRYGHSVMAIHLAMNEPPRWHDERLNDVIYTHICDGLDGVSRNFNETTRRLLPADPVVGVGTPTLLDPDRAPEGKAVMVLQVLDVPYTFHGDAAGQIDVGDGTWTDEVANAFADRIFEIVGKHIVNFKDAVLARHIITPADLADANPNWVNGDPYSGSHDISQSFLLRPIAGQPAYQTPVSNLFMIGAATHPGLGLGSNSGFVVAQHLLK